MYKISGAMFLLTAVFTAASVLARAILNIEFIGYYELMGILSGIAIICSLASAEEHSVHVKIDIIKFSDHKLIRSVRYFLLAVMYLGLMLGQFIAAYESWFRSYKTSMLEVPIYIFYSISACCFMFISVIAIKKTIKSLIELRC
jgi:TRAP-type C4-dicarboxylate transport system permease small subunit